MGRGMEGWEGKEKEGKGRKEKGGSKRGKEDRERGARLDLDICSGAPEFLVTPLKICKANYFICFERKNA